MTQAIISIVVPTYNEAENIEELYRRVALAFQGLGYGFELIFVDDSRDATPEIIKSLHQRDGRVKLIRMVRRFGQSCALAAGLERATGAAAVMMDADLQDPPEAIPLLIKKWEEGNRIVYAQRRSESPSLLYRFLARRFYRVLARIASVQIPVDAGEFRLIDRVVIDFLNRLKERSRFMRGLTVWPGYSMAKIEITRGERFAGKTNYNLLRSTLVGLEGFVSFSIIPLRLATLFGLAGAILAVVLGLTYVLVWIFDRKMFGAGWMSLFLAITFMGSLNLFCMGIAGEYVGQIFLELQGRPLYLVDYELGFDSTPIADEDGRRRSPSPQA